MSDEFQTTYIVIIPLDNGKRLRDSEYNLSLRQRYVEAYDRWKATYELLHKQDYPPPVKQSLEKQETRLRDTLALCARHYQAFNGYFGEPAVTIDMNIN